MKRFTTPTHKIKLALDPSEWEEFRITYSQAGKTVLEKNETDVGKSVTFLTKEDANGKEYHIVKVQLTQSESGLFRPKLNVVVQIRCYYHSGATLASNEMIASVEDVLNQEILGDGE